MPAKTVAGREDRISASGKTISRAKAAKIKEKAAAKEKLKNQNNGK